ncbi:hypothetical protein AArcSl_0359 [Halalkaliarchaeum desulfuricum]|uniref:Uncharacterized protein n=1 Tax=Halalkaliarchaeum desulfuricum TaxID=2055893 RepID=A0A343TFZ0_9EURY|nr:hypothetical protein [Halalkaliarchaeum desulfuricum]AUX08012.1 hypothetical protein AArcSl_0359 [Halalkaliarchaeum desulfuricum]
MALHRRHLLAATAAAGAGVFGVGYWQRRRLGRLPTIRALDNVVESEVPRIEDDPIITPSLLEASYDRTDERFEEIEARLEPPYDRYSEEFIENLRTRLADRAPENVTIWPRGAPAMHYANRQALFTYRRVRGRLAGILAYESPEELPPETFQERSAIVGQRIDSFAVPYQGTTLGESIIAGATIESLVGAAESHLENAGERDEYAHRWRELERATAAIEDAEAFATARNGTDYANDVQRIADGLVAEYDRRREDAPDHHDVSGIDDARSTFVFSATTPLQRSMRNLGATPSIARGLLEDGDFARAAFTYALLLPTVPLYGAFADVPDFIWWEEYDYELGAEPADLREEKQATIDVVEQYLGTEDPLVSLFAAVPLGALRRTDSRLDGLIEDAHTVDDSEWAMQLDRALLLYEGARRYAEAIGDVIDLVNEL